MVNWTEKGGLDVRKRTIKCAADTIFWYIIYMLPVLAYLIWVFAVCGNSGFEGITISDMRGALNFGNFCFNIYFFLSP